MRKLVFDLGGWGLNFSVSIVWLLVFAIAVPAGARGEELEAMGLEALEARAQEIERELGALALAKVVGGIGSVGFETGLHGNPQRTEWVEVAWEKPLPIDQVVLVPTIWRAEKGGCTADGFPLDFRVLAGSGGDKEGTVIATFTGKNGHLPRSAPLLIPCRTTASWVRVEATLLSRRAYDRHYNMQFSELMVFSGEENVALKQAVQTSSIGREEGGRRARSQLTDGFLPYEMSVPAAASSGACKTTHEPGVQPHFVFDLGQSTPINRIHLHPIESSNTFPADVPIEFGVPDHFVIEGANRADFSDAVKLTERHRSSSFDVGPLFMERFPEGSYRFVRVKALQPNANPRVLGFSEIEIFSKGQNVAPGKKVNFSEPLPLVNPGSVNDGLNRYGRIVPLRQWMGELARRHDLQTELPLVRQEIQRQYDRQTQQRTVLAWIAALALAGGVVAVLVARIRNMRQITELRERFAADLHDELGASLRSIGMLTEMAHEAEGSSRGAGSVSMEIQDTIADTLMAMRCRIERHMQPAVQNLPDEMRNFARRILADIRWNLEIDGEEHLAGLKPLPASDIMLFFKECLVNISRHSKATQVRAVLHAMPKRVRLEVADNGRGLSGGPPPSLERRARLLGGKMTATVGQNGETIISLTLRP